MSPQEKLGRHSQYACSSPLLTASLHMNMKSNMREAHGPSMKQRVRGHCILVQKEFGMNKDIREGGKRLRLAIFSWVEYNNCIGLSRPTGKTPYPLISPVSLPILVLPLHSPSCAHTTITPPSTPPGDHCYCTLGTQRNGADQLSVCSAG